MEVLTAVLTAALVAITAYYAWQTRQTVEAMRQTSREQLRPRVGVYLVAGDRSASMSHIMIKNYGGTVAKNVRFRLDKDLEVNIAGKEKLSDYRVFKRGLKNLFPGQELIQFFLPLAGRPDGFFDEGIKIEVAYSSLEGKAFTEEYYLDFASMPEVRNLTSNMTDLVKEVKKISEVLKKQ